jgi:hypothetical protein
MSSPTKSWWSPKRPRSATRSACSTSCSPPAPRSSPVPEAFLLPGDYKVEVLAIAAGGNQTLTEVAFTVE